MTQPTADKLLWMYETMLLIRRYEETMAEVYLEGKLPPRIQQASPSTSPPVRCRVRCTWRPARSPSRWACART